MKAQNWKNDIDNDKNLIFFLLNQYNCIEIIHSSHDSSSQVGLHQIP